jgi:hypothetical protein
MFSMVTFVALFLLMLTPAGAGEVAHRSQTFMDEGSASLKWDGFDLPDRSPLAPYTLTPMFQGVSTGDADAGITLVLVDSDPFHELHYYSKFYRRTLPEIEKRYVSTGIARIVAIPIQAGGNYGIALWCADDQEAGWQFNKTAYGDYGSLLNSLVIIENENDIQVFETIADQAGLDLAKFSRCLRQRRALLPVSDDGTNQLLSGSNRMVEHPARISAVSISVGASDSTQFTGTTLHLPRNTPDAMLDWLDVQIQRLISATD